MLISHICRNSDAQVQKEEGMRIEFSIVCIFDSLLQKCAASMIFEPLWFVFLLIDWSKILFFSIRFILLQLKLLPFISPSPSFILS